MADRTFSDYDGKKKPPEKEKKEGEGADDTELDRGDRAGVDRHGHGTPDQGRIEREEERV